jgi:hypothetical protein
MSRTWNWADLNSEQLEIVKDAEQSLGADYLLAFQPTAAGEALNKESTPDGIHVAQLTESQLECLQGLEAQIEATIVAYKHD